MKFGAQEGEGELLKEERSSVTGRGPFSEEGDAGQEG